ncbi:MAG: hypothetical protein R3D85_08115 [Paracoccaceae bacterium]
MAQHGIVTTFAIVAGFAGAAADGAAQDRRAAVLVFGLATSRRCRQHGPACSSLSTRSAHDLLHACRAREAAGIHHYPAQERAELLTILRRTRPVHSTGPRPRSSPAAPRWWPI